VPTQPAAGIGAVQPVPMSPQSEHPSRHQISGSVEWPRYSRVWPGDVGRLGPHSPSIIDHGGGRIALTLTGIDPRLRLALQLATQMREGVISALSRAPNAIIIGDAWRRSSLSSRHP